MNLKCLCCGKEATFMDGNDAFKAGWDAPPLFSFTICDKCPASHYFLKKPCSHDFPEGEMFQQPLKEMREAKKKAVDKKEG